MIGVFPTLHPEELLYSACARYQSMMGYPALSSTAVDLFGAQGMPASVDFPVRLSCLAERLPHGHPYSARQLLDEHTTLPYFRPFLSPERLARVEAMMLGLGSATIALNLGLSTRSVPLPSHLRFCPLCARADRSAFGEPVWRRVHQLPGVLICPVHAVTLRVSSVLRVNRFSRRQYVALQAVLREAAPLLRIPRRSRATALWLARASQWLLSRQAPGPGLNTLQQRYRTLLTDRGFLRDGARKVRTSELIEACRTYYGDEMLGLLACSLRLPLSGATAGNWLARLIGRRRPQMHPLQHLLLLHFLGYLPSDLLDPPFECAARATTLSRAVDHTREVRTHRAPPPATPEWIERLRQLVADPQWTIEAMARELGVSPTTVKERARRFGVWRSGWLGWDALAPRPGLKVIMRQRIAAYRAEWLQVRDAHPTATRTALLRLAPRAARCLARYDRTWFNGHQPPSRRGQRGSGRVVDWEARDQSILAEVKEAIASIRRQPGRPRRVTRTAIARRIGHIDAIFKHLRRLPRTARYIAAHLDSAAEIARRRLVWVFEHHLASGRTATCAKLLELACVRPQVKMQCQRQARRLSIALSEQVPARSDRTDIPVLRSARQVTR